MKTKPLTKLVGGFLLRLGEYSRLIQYRLITRYNPRRLLLFSSTDPLVRDFIQIPERDDRIIPGALTTPGG